jgi:hypothetical protein
MIGNSYMESYRKEINKNYGKTFIQYLYLIQEKHTDIGILSFINDNNEINIGAYSICKNLKIIFYLNYGDKKMGIMPCYRNDLLLRGLYLTIGELYKKLSCLENNLIFENLINKCAINLNKKTQKPDFKRHDFSSTSEKDKNFIYNLDSVKKIIIFNLNFCNFSIL